MGLAAIPKSPPVSLVWGGCYKYLTLKSTLLTWRTPTTRAVSEVGDYLSAAFRWAPQSSCPDSPVFQMSRPPRPPSSLSVCSGAASTVLPPHTHACFPVPGGSGDFSPFCHSVLGASKKNWHTLSKGWNRARLSVIGLRSAEASVSGNCLVQLSLSFRSSLPLFKAYHSWVPGDWLQLPKTFHWVSQDWATLWKQGPGDLPCDLSGDIPEFFIKNAIISSQSPLPCLSSISIKTHKLNVEQIIILSKGFNKENSKLHINAKYYKSEMNL